jgi:DNA-binding MarR family transcriptional regulator
MSDDQHSTRDVMSGLLKVVEQFEMLPATYISAFLVIARDPGHSVDTYAKALGIAPATMSRRLIDLGEQQSRCRKRAGHCLIESRRNPVDRRLVEIQLSPKGKALATRLERLVSKRAASPWPVTNS